MTEFNVWAPSCSKMAVVVDGKKSEMELAASGWWSADVAADDECDYIFALDDQRQLPDPRSPFQPEGVHGSSRRVNPATFKWTDERFQAPPLSSAIIYELHIGTFTPHGTFDSTIEKLSHLSRLGVTHVELMPVVEFAGTRGWGYDGVYPYAPHHGYGGPYGLQRLIDACHAEGLAVILDVVYNHLGPSGNYLPRFGPYFSDRHQTPWGSAINFDGPYSDEVRRYFIDNALMWLRDYHFDGLRIDAIHAIVDTSAIPFLEQLATEIKRLEAHLGRHLVIIAESDLNDPRVIRGREFGGFGFDAQWADDFHHALHVALTQENQGYYCDFCGLRDLASAFQKPFLFHRGYSKFRRRSHGKPPHDLEGFRFLAYSQTHDQVGNRANGERLHQICGVRRAKMAAALTFFSPYVPMLFQGEEWAASGPFQYFVDFAEDPALARAVAEGRCSEFQAFGAAAVADPQDEQTFLRSKLKWDELPTATHREMLAWYRELIALCRRAPALSDGNLDIVRTQFDEDDQWLTIRRGNVWLAANFADEPRDIPSPSSSKLKLLLTSDPEARADPDGFHLPPECIVLAQEVASLQETRKRRSGRLERTTAAAPMRAPDM